MAKRNPKWDERKIQNYIKEGRGQGKGSEYKPWLKVQDFPSSGLSSRVCGWKNNRVCHFLSRIEMNYYYLLEWSDLVVDIREQYPLIEQEKTKLIAEELGVKHPVDNINKTPLVLTTDFYITLKIEGREVNIARTVKPSKELNKKSVIEKFEIERKYWDNRNIDWGIVTEKDINETVASNIEFLYPAYRLENTVELEVKDLYSIAEILKNKLKKVKNKEILINDILSETDKEMNIEEGTSLYLFRHLVAKKEISLNMKEKINPFLPTSSIYSIGEVQKNYESQENFA